MKKIQLKQNMLNTMTKLKKFLRTFGTTEIITSDDYKIEWKRMLF